jgi:hypothetical protein
MSSHVRNAAERTSEHRGVTWNPRTQQWRALVGLDGRLHRLGEYEDENEAARVCREFRRQWMPFALA